MPERLPVPEVTKIELAFPTGAHTPDWELVPDEFRNEPGGNSDNRNNPWVQAANVICLGRRQWHEWSAIPHEGIDPEKAHMALQESLGSWGLGHAQKVATVGWMMSEWFEDYWWKGDTVTVVHQHVLKDWIDGWEG